jgi:hypothetical protein
MPRRVSRTTAGLATAALAATCLGVTGLALADGAAGAPTSAAPVPMSTTIPPSVPPSTPPSIGPSVPPTPPPTSPPGPLPAVNPPKMRVDPAAPRPTAPAPPPGPISVAGNVACRAVPSYAMRWNGELWWLLDPNPFVSRDLERYSTPVGRGFGIGAQTRAFGASGHGVLYRVDAYGRLFWYRHNDPYGGRASWANAGRGLYLGGGFAPGVVSSVSVGPKGALYVITVDGRLWLYRHTGWQTGASSWANGGAPLLIGHGFGWADRIYPAGGGVLYRSDIAHRLSWYRYTLDETAGSPRSPRVRWAAGSGRVVGRDLDGFAMALGSAGAGVLYSADRHAEIRLFRHLDPATGGATWAAPYGTYIGPTAYAPQEGFGLAVDPTACTIR